MQGWLLIHGRYAHQPDYGQIPALARIGDEPIGFRRRDAAFLRLFTRIHLHEELRATSLLLHRGGERFGEAGAVERLDDIEELHRVSSLVGLQGADQVQSQIRTARLQVRIFCRSFLDPVLAKRALTGGDGF